MGLQPPSMEGGTEGCGAGHAGMRGGKEMGCSEAPLPLPGSQEWPFSVTALWAPAPRGHTTGNCFGGKEREERWPLRPISSCPSLQRHSPG